MARLIGWLVLIGIAAAVPVGCGDATNEPTQAGPAGSASSKSQLVFVSASEPNTLDPQRMSWLHSIRAAECLYRPLMRYTLPQLELEPATAKSVEVSDDQLTYTFHLREDAAWSNGDPVTAHDFIAAWRRALLPDFAADYVKLLFHIEGAEAFFDWRTAQLERLANLPDNERAQAARQAWNEAIVHFDETVGVEAADDRTLVVTLAQPTPYFLELCAFITFAPNHAGTLETMMTLNETSGMMTIAETYWTDPDRLVSNGPYVLADHAFKQYMQLDPNPHYWDRENVANGGIRMKVIENPQSALQTYSQGGAHWLPDIPTATSLAADLVKSGRRDVHAAPWAGTYFYSFNCLPTLADGTANPLAQRAVRRALSLAINRADVVNYVTGMKQPIARSFVPSGKIPGYAPPTDEGVTFNPGKAKELLAMAGHPNGEGLENLTLLYNTGAGHEGIAQAIRSMWQDHLGITVSLEGVEVSHFGERLKNQKYTIARAAWIGDYRDPTTFLDKYRTNDGNNDAKFSHQQYDRLLDQAKQATDPAERMDLLRRAEAILLREQPIAPIFHFITLHVFNPQEVKGLDLNAWNVRRLERVSVR